jgi:hypothetical protein
LETKGVPITGTPFFYSFFTTNGTGDINVLCGRKQNFQRLLSKHDDGAGESGGRVSRIIFHTLLLPPSLTEKSAGTQTTDSFWKTGRLHLTDSETAPSWAALYPARTQHRAGFGAIQI